MLYNVYVLKQKMLYGTYIHMVDALHQIFQKKLNNKLLPSVSMLLVSIAVTRIPGLLRPQRKVLATRQSRLLEVCLKLHFVLAFSQRNMSLYTNKYIIYL